MDAVDEDKSYKSYIFCTIVIIFERNVDEGGVSKSWNLAEVIRNYADINIFFLDISLGFHDIYIIFKLGSGNI